MTKELRELLVKNNIDERQFKRIENTEKLFYVIKETVGVKENTFVEFIELQLGEVVGDYRDDLLIALGTCKGDIGRIFLDLRIKGRI